MEVVVDVVVVLIQRRKRTWPNEIKERLQKTSKRNNKFEENFNPSRSAKYVFVIIQISITIQSNDLVNSVPIIFRMFIVSEMTVIITVVTVVVDMFC